MKSGIRVQKIAEKPETEKQKMSPKQNPLDEEQIASMNPYEKSAPRIRERFVFESE